MHNLILSPINPDTLIDRVAEKTFNLLKNSRLGESKDASEELLTQDEAAKFLKCTTTSLFRLRKADKIKQYGLGGKRYYKKSELLEALTVVNN
jgi:hypothetical protein